MCNCADCDEVEDCPFVRDWVRQLITKAVELMQAGQPFILEMTPVSEEEFEEFDDGCISIQ